MHITSCFGCILARLFIEQTVKLTLDLQGGETCKTEGNYLSKSPGDNSVIDVDIECMFGQTILFYKGSSLFLLLPIEVLLVVQCIRSDRRARTLVQSLQSLFARKSSKSFPAHEMSIRPYDASHLFQITSRHTIKDFLPIEISLLSQTAQEEALDR